MPSAPLLARTASRRVVLLALAAALAAVLVSLAATETGSACGGPPPIPLRALYSESDLVVVARVGQSVSVEMAPVDDQSLKVYLTKTSLHVNSTVKGQGNHGVVALYHLIWQSKDDAETFNRFDGYGDGDKLLFFLKRRADGEGYEQADSSYAVKKLSDADLRVYVERMNELGLILQQEKPDPARITEWLVRCAEEPATRWEGLYELTSSKYAADATEAEEKEKASAAAGAEAVEEGGEKAGGEADGASLNHGGPPAEGAAEAEAAEAEGETASADPRLARMLDTSGTFYTPDPELIGLLTAEQKKRLADALFNAEQLSDDASMLIGLVKDWHDPRFVPFALAQLRSFGDEPPPVAADLMTALADSLGDEGLMRLAASYSEKSTYYDEDADDAAMPPPDAAAREALAEEASAEDPAEKAFEESLVGNSAQKRRLRLQRFIARAEVALAN